MSAKLNAAIAICRCRNSASEATNAKMIEMRSSA